MNWWKSAKLEDAIGAWAPFAGRDWVAEVDDRFKKELGEVGPHERALMMGWRLARAHRHLEAGHCPGPFAGIWAMRNGFPAFWLPESPLDVGVPIQSIRSHVTVTGRLRWEAKDDGTIRLEVWRGPGAGRDAHLVLSAVVRAEARTDQYNDGVTCDLVEVDVYAPFGARHVEVLIEAIAMAMGNDYHSYEDEAIRAQLAALGIQEPDPWDPVNAPDVPPVGTRVLVVSEEIDHSYDARVTGAEAEWEPSHRDWALLVEDDDGWERRPLVREIRPAPEPEA